MSAPASPLITKMRATELAPAIALLLLVQAPCRAFVEHAARGTVRRTGTRIAAEEGGSPDEEVVCGHPSDLFPEKIMDGVKFNLFGAGRAADEDRRHGSFQPPPRSMEGTTVLITGASSGLGLESARRLALGGATVVLTARTQAKVHRAVNDAVEYCRDPERGQYVNASPKVVGITLDLDDFSTVRSFPERYRSSMSDRSLASQIDVLMNNAGGGGHPTREVTVDGFEKTFQSNHLGHFLLTSLLFENDLATRDGRGCTVINVSSITHRCAEATHSAHGEERKEAEFGYDFDNMNCDIAYSGEAYCQAKLANVLFTRELQRRADLHKSGWLTAVSLEPGGVATDIWRHVLGYDPRTFDKRCRSGEELTQPPNRGFIDKLSARLFYRIATQVQRGANVQIWLAYLHASEQKAIEKGQHYDEFRTVRPVPKYVNESNSERLWTLSEDMAGIKFGFD